MASKVWSRYFQWIDRLNNYISEDIEDMRPDYDPALRQHIVTNRRNFFIDLAIEEQAFSHRETSHPLKRTVATIRYYHHLSLDAAKVVNTFPAALCYNPESVKVKIDNLTELGLDAVKLVNTFPTTLDYNPSKINIAAYSLMKAGLWEATAEFEGYKAILNRGEQTGIFTIPIESLVLYLNNNKHDTQKSLFRAVRNHTKQLGATSGEERKSLMMNELLDKDSRQKMGYIAVLYSLKEKLDIDFSK